MPVSIKSISSIFARRPSTNCPSSIPSSLQRPHSATDRMPTRQQTGELSGKPTTYQSSFPSSFPIVQLVSLPRFQPTSRSTVLSSVLPLSQTFHLHNSNFLLCPRSDLPSSAYSTKLVVPLKQVTSRRAIRNARPVQNHLTAHLCHNQS